MIRTREGFGEFIEPGKIRGPISVIVLAAAGRREHQGQYGTQVNSDGFYSNSLEEN